MIHYRLSNRQRKELLIRGRPIAISLPIAEEVRDPIAVARRLLPELDGQAGERISRAEVATIYVAPLVGSDCDGGLTAILGRIADEACGHWIVTHEVLIVEISPHKPRGTMTPLQWPGGVLLDGRPIMAERG